MKTQQPVLPYCKDKNPRNESWRGKTPLHFAVIYNDLETCQFIIENIQNINPKDYDGNTPLHIATEYRLENLCQLIIENIQNVNPKNNFGTTPLQIATERGYENICKLINSALEQRKYSFICP